MYIEKISSLGVTIEELLKDEREKRSSKGESEKQSEKNGENQNYH